MKIALVHDYLTQKGGAERVFEMFCEHFEDADIYTSVYDAQKTIELRNRLVNTTFLQKVPGAKRFFRLFAPLYFPAFRALDLSEYDLILSSSSSFAKAVKKRPDAKHICFCHNVSRFLWDTKTYLDGYQDYEHFEFALKYLFQFMRKQDIAYADEPDLYISNSTTVAQRIRNIYEQRVITVNYPINDECFSFSDQKEDFHLVASRLISYKRIDIIVSAFNQLGWPLYIIGTGPEHQRLKAKAASNIHFLGHVSDAERMRLLSKAKSVVVAALEDYGLVPIEANFSGTPVIAYGEGGALETQISGVTGLFFEAQTANSLRSTLLRAQSMTWDYAAIRQHAERNFTRKAFFQKVDHVVENLADYVAQAKSSDIVSREKGAGEKGDNSDISTDEVPTAQPISIAKAEHIQVKHSGVF